VIHSRGESYGFAPRKRFPIKKKSDSRKKTPRSFDEIGRKSSEAVDVKKWDLRLYVTGQTPRSIDAFANLKRLCEDHLAGRYKIEIIDLLQHPVLAAGDQIIAIPMLVRKLPHPIRKIVGDLRDTERALGAYSCGPNPKGFELISAREHRSDSPSVFITNLEIWVGEKRCIFKQVHPELRV